MKKYYLSHLCLILFFWIGCSVDSNPFIELDGVHIRNDIRYRSGEPREYRFNNVPDYKGFVAVFPWKSVRVWVDEDALQSVDIEYWIFTSVDDAELFMVERNDLSSLYMKNMIDFPLPKGKIGDNCWYQDKYSIILFIRNNVWVSIRSPNWENIESVARMVDQAILCAKKVSRKWLIPAPIIQSLEFLSPIPYDWGQTVKVKVNAFDPHSKQVYFRKVGDGLRIIRTNGVFAIRLNKSVQAHVSQDPNKFRILIWAWNEEHLVSLVEKEIPFWQMRF